MMINQDTFFKKWQAAVPSGRKPLGLYIHIPFCRRKCRYCDFVSFAGCEDEMDPYVDRLCEEIRTRGREYCINPSREGAFCSNVPGSGPFAGSPSQRDFSAGNPSQSNLSAESSLRGDAFCSNVPGSDPFAGSPSQRDFSAGNPSQSNLSAENPLSGDAFCSNVPVSGPFAGSPSQSNLSAGNSFRNQYYVDSIFIGGGTPSLLSPAQLSKIVAAVDEAFVCVRPEFTVECNPGTVDEEKFRAMKALGVNRISLGVQSLSNPVLKKLGRIHDNETALKAMDMAASAGLDYNVDLMFGVPGQTLGIWKKTLRTAVEKGPAHISFYSLQLEEDTPLYEAYQDGRADLPSWEENREMYHFAVDFLREAGYRHYEISNAALPGKECRHNIKYWTMGDYLGLGLAAYSFVDGKRFYNTADMERYLYAPGFGRYDEEPDETGLKGDWVFTALRLTEGFALKDYETYFRSSFMEDFGPAADALVADGLLEVYGRKPSVEDESIEVASDGVPGAVQIETGKTVPDGTIEIASDRAIEIASDRVPGTVQIETGKTVPDGAPGVAEWVRMTQKGLDYTNPVMEKLLEQLSADGETHNSGPDW